MNLLISSVRAGDRLTIGLRGELDYGTAPALREAISTALAADPLPATISVDLGGVTVVDSTGLGTLVVGYRICAQVRVRLAVCNPTPFVSRLLSVTGADTHLVRAAD
ncbi:MAG TPA: STAS domain-containing protein [Micromonosporaceae bacterium]|nr:STAS domain-containing protein [Micromonosporaceae bacterium]